MLVNARLLYISVDGSHYSLDGQVIFTVSLWHRFTFLTDQEIHLATETEQDQTRLPLLQ
jgi:hypothetical protein